MFNRSREWGWRGENPAAGIRVFKEQKRQSFLDGDELPSFFASLAQEKNVTVRDSILASLLTGARQSNVASMSWSEIRGGRSQRQERPVVPLLGLLFRRLGIERPQARGWAAVGRTVIGVLLAALVIWGLQCWSHGWSQPSPRDAVPAYGGRIVSPLLQPGLTAGMGHRIKFPLRVLSLSAAVGKVK